MIGPSGPVEKDTKTHSARKVSVDPTTLATLRRHRKLVVDRAVLCEVRVRPTAFVFSQEVDGSEAWRPDSTARAFARLCRRAGLEGVRLHVLPHYVATRLLASGVDVRTVAGASGTVTRRPP